jgi:hypothetical protein
MSLRNRALQPGDIAPRPLYSNVPPGHVKLELPDGPEQLSFIFAQADDPACADLISHDDCCGVLRRHSIGVGWRYTAEIFAELERNEEGSAA